MGFVTLVPRLKICSEMILIWARNKENNVVVCRKKSYCFYRFESTYHCEPCHSIASIVFKVHSIM